MNEEERLTLNNYLEDLHQAMQIGDIKSIVTKEQFESMKYEVK